MPQTTPNPSYLKRGTRASVGRKPRFHLMEKRLPLDGKNALNQWMNETAYFFNFLQIILQKYLEKSELFCIFAVQ